MSIRMIMEDALDKWLMSDSGISSAAVRVRMAMRDMKPRTIRDMVRICGASQDTVRRAVEELVAAQWATDIRQRDQRPRSIGAVFPPEVEAVMCDPILLASTGAPFTGEWTMRALLDLFAGSKSYIDNHRPEFIRRQETGYRLECDRHYPEHMVIFEYQGSSHHRPASQSKKEEQYKDQVNRDAQKALFAKRMGIEIVEVTAVELTGNHMIELISGRLPLTAYAFMPDSQLVRFLKGMANSYAAKVLRSERQ